MGFFEGKTPKIGRTYLQPFGYREKPSWIWVRKGGEWMIKVDCWRASGWRQNFEPWVFFFGTVFGKHGLFSLAVFFGGDVLPPPRDRRAYSLYGGGERPRGIRKGGGVFFEFS